MTKAIQQGIKITIYQELPKSWDGKKHYMGGFDNLSDEELKEEGFYNVVTPDYNTRSEYLSAIVFDEDKEIFTYNVLDHSNFFSKVWFRTLGGSIPMMFQENSEDNNIDSFSVVRIQSNSLKITKQSVRTYEISLTLEECW